jgi:hypothetical protein
MHPVSNNSTNCLPACLLIACLPACLVPDLFLLYLMTWLFLAPSATTSGDPREEENKE